MSAPLRTPLVVGLLIALAQAASFGVEIINGKIAKKGSLRNNMSVVLGSPDIKEGNKNIQRFTVMSRKNPKQYKNVSSGNDIMLLQLSKKVKLSKNVNTVKLQMKDKTISPKTKCIVAGWGSTGLSASVTNLHVVNVSTIDLDVCQNEWSEVKKKLPDNIICAGGYETKSGACQGDSGGPLVCSGLAVGIVSFNYNGNCNYPNVPNVYTQISKFLPWIKKYIKKIS
ncbi:hypothetical protein SKAU_G00050870 [Synaphobranchus kaupii]|uniref:Peptidase S1 domain-containing protein n=1 Tax=Synaphobranchus kaupii TaxID=118154 RepID=A0A9Q1J9S2_SYNKA|nr:hypothetical protein SKAU_G00050870 [Synaphobranchus kaupii]